MNWEDERWVKLYTRDSVTWLSWDWRARFVMMSLIRKVDRAGVVDVGSRGIEGIAELLNIPADIVNDAIPQLIAPGDDGQPTIAWNGPQLVILRFIDAQESKTSSSARQRASRERRRDFAIRGVEVSRNVTAPGSVAPCDGSYEDMGPANEDLDENGHTARRTPAEHVTPRGRVTSDVTRRDSDPDLTSALAHFSRQFRARYGHLPTPPLKQQRDRLREILDVVGLSEWRDRIVRAFTEERDFPRHPYDLRTILQFFDRFAISQPPQHNGRGASPLHEAALRAMRNAEQQRDAIDSPSMPWEEE